LKKFLILLFIIMAPVNAFSKTLHLEKVYQEFWCGRVGGQTEVVLPDRSRVDCLTKAYAVEVDFAGKWAEAIGQALFYSALTGKEPGILIIIEQPNETHFLKRLRLAIKGFKLPIRVWVMGPADLK